MCDEHYPRVDLDWSWMWHSIRRGYWCLKQGMVKQWYYAHKAAFHHFKRIFKAIKKQDFNENHSITQYWINQEVYGKEECMSCKRKIIHNGWCRDCEGNIMMSFFRGGSP